MEQVPELSESPEKKATKSGKINLRKSFAWDNAFFTSEGVLNTEELAIVNSTFRRAEAHSLPVIQEDIMKSTESASALDNAIWELETLEVDVFENVRASIQKSFGKCDKSAELVLPNKSVQQGEQNASCFGSTKKVGISSQNKMKLPNTSRRHDVIKEREDTLIHGKVDASGISDSKSSPRPPRINASRATTLPAMPGKSASASGDIQTKNNLYKSLSGMHIGAVSSQSNVPNRQSVIALKRSGESRSNAANRQSVVALKKSGASSSAIPRSTPSANSISGLRPGNDFPSVSHSSDLSRKSPLEGLRKYNPRNTDHTSSESITKTLPRVSKSKYGHKNEISPSMLKLSSSASNSSIDSMVSESSSSSSVAMMNHSYLTESIVSGSSLSFSLPVSLKNSLPRPSQYYKLSTDPPCHRTVNSGSLPRGQLSTGDHSRSLVNSSSGANYSKPSGLRMPSPKIGYFDPEKSLVCSSRKYSQSGLPNNLPKRNTGIGNTSGANKLKPAKLPPVRSAEQRENMGGDFQHTRTTRLSSIHGSKPSSLSTLRRPPKPAGLCETPKAKKDPHVFSNVDKHLSPITRKVGHLEVFDVGTAVYDMTDCTQLSNLIADKRTSHMNSMPMIDSLDEKESSFSGGWNSCHSCKTPQLTEQKGETEKYEQSLTMPYKKEGRIETESNSTLQAVQKENLLCSDKNAGLVDLVGQKVLSLSLFEAKSCAGGEPESSPRISVPVVRGRCCHILQNSSNLGLLPISPTRVDLGPNTRTLADTYLLFDS